MLKAIETFLKTRSSGDAPAGTVKATAWGKGAFCCFDLYDDTFIFEEGIWDDVQNKDPVVLLQRRRCAPRRVGRRRVLGNIL